MPQINAPAGQRRAAQLNIVIAREVILLSSSRGGKRRGDPGNFNQRLAQRSLDCLARLRLKASPDSQ